MSEEKESVIQITQHCKERYAERIMGKQAKNEIAVYIAQNQQKIEEDINKMYLYGQCIFTGVLKGSNVVDAIVSGTWVLLVDQKDKKVITLYKVDFGLGEDFNKNYMEQMLYKVHGASTNYEAVVKQAEEEKNTYKATISDFEAQIKEHRAIINKLSTQIEGFEQVLKGADAQIDLAYMDLRDCVMAMICKKEF